MVFLHICWIVVFCFFPFVSIIHCSVNLAADQTAFQSTRQNGSTTSGRAVDGSYSGFCAVTDRDNEAFWLVKLAASSVITHVRLLFDLAVSEDPRFLRNYKIYVSNDDNPQTGNLCYEETRSTSAIDSVKNEVFCYTTGTYVSMYTNHRVGGIALIGLCEVEVFGCPVGYYGSTCTSKCSENCNTQPCEPDFGRCINGCKPGFSGEQCKTGCPEGFYGSGCSNTCSINCKGAELCNPDSGECIDGCTPGYTGEKCDNNCTAGMYGAECAFSCSVTCVNSVCNYVNGTCEQCVEGYTGNMCDVVISGTSDTNGVDHSSTTTEDADSSTTFIIATGVLASALLVLLVVIVCMFVSKRNKNVNLKSKGDKHPLSREDTLNKEYDDMHYAIPGSPENQQNITPVLEYEDPVSRSNNSRNMNTSRIYPNNTFRGFNGNSSQAGERNRTFSNIPSIKNTQKNTGLANKGEVTTYEGLQMDEMGNEKNVYDDLGQ